MFNAKLILVLLYVNNFNRKIVNALIKYKLPTNFEIKTILDFFYNCPIKIPNLYNINSITILEAIKKSNSTICHCNLNDINIITILDESFPNSLKNIDDNPVIIFYKGNINCALDNNCISIIGSRNASSLDKFFTKKLSYYLGCNNITVVSGLAIGCDESAHLGCLLSKGKTVAILPCGLDYIYPKSNLQLAKNIIASNGCIVSEYTPGEKISKFNCLDRNRLVSGLSKGIIVIEYTPNSGTMNTINYGVKQNKKIAYFNPSKKSDSKPHIKCNLINDFESLREFLSFCNDTQLNNTRNSVQLQFEF